MARRTVRAIVIFGLLAGYFWASWGFYLSGFVIHLANPTGSGPCRERDFRQCRPSRGSYLEAVNPFHFQLNPYMQMILEGHR